MDRVENCLTIPSMNRNVIKQKNKLNKILPHSFFSHVRRYPCHAHLCAHNFRPYVIRNLYDEIIYGTIHFIAFSGLSRKKSMKVILWGGSRKTIVDKFKLAYFIPLYFNFRYNFNQSNNARLIYPQVCKFNDAMRRQSRSNGGL